MTEFEWHYLERGRVTHARKRRDSGLDRTARCGQAPVWFAWGEGWFGTGKQAEYERAAALPKCSRCVKLLGGAR